MANRPDYDALRLGYAADLGMAKQKPGWVGAFERAARYAIRHKTRYQTIERQSGVPWAFIAALHWRESQGSFKTHLHNGDSLARRTRRVPSGRPLGTPPFTWEESALDALRMKGMHQIRDWSLARMCYEAERYNGFGYRNRGLRSPYLWSGTNLYRRGKYVRDGSFDPSVVDKQVGVIPLYQTILRLNTEAVVVDKSRKLTGMRRIVDAIKAFFATIASLFTLDSLGVVREWFSFSDIFDPKLMVTLGIAGLILYVVSQWIERMTLKDYRDGRYRPSGMEPGYEPNPELPYDASDGTAGWSDHVDHRLAAEREGLPGGDRGGSAQGALDLPDDDQRAADRPAESRDPE